MDIWIVNKQDKECYLINTYNNAVLSYRNRTVNINTFFEELSPRYEDNNIVCSIMSDLLNKIEEAGKEGRTAMVYCLPLPSTNDNDNNVSIEKNVNNNNNNAQKSAKMRKKELKINKGKKENGTL